MTKSIGLLGLVERRPEKICRRRNTIAPVARRLAPQRRRHRLQTIDVSVQTDEPDLWCICRKPDDGQLMVACDHAKCAITWFHSHCVGLTSAPKGNWYCANCNQLQKQQKK